MWLVLIFVVVAGGAWFILSRLPVREKPSARDTTDWSAAGRAAAGGMVGEADPALANLERITGEKFVRMRGGGMKPQSELDEQDESLAAFRATLTRWPLPDLDGTALTLFYDGTDGPGRQVELRAVLIGRDDFYLECWWPERDDSRLFRADRIELIIDRAGTRHRRAIDWIMSGGAAGVTLGTELGYRSREQAGQND